jgi:hypothetical protein
VKSSLHRALLSLLPAFKKLTSQALVPPERQAVPVLLAVAVAAVAVAALVWLYKLNTIVGGVLLHNVGTLL